MLYMEVAKPWVIFWKGDPGILERLSVSVAQLELASIGLGESQLLQGFPH